MFKIILIVALATLASASPTNNKIAPTLLESDVAEILVSFESTSKVLSNVNSLKYDSRDEKLNNLHQSLQAHASIAQKSVQEFLNSEKIGFTSFWVNNQLYIKSASAVLIQKLASFENVVSIRRNEYIELEPINIIENGVLAEWGVENIQANVVWTYPGGSSGTGIRAANIDTGVRGTHEALVGNFLGTYGWYDPGAKTATPNDQNGHGTHTIGTIAGQNGIGVAPGAHWQACKGCASTSCSNADLIGCGQWVVCPTLTDGVSQPNCTFAPHVVSNSWAGGRGDGWYDDVIRAWHSAQIIPVFANGNSGSNCNTANSPADSEAGVIAVGATTSSNTLASFSSRGPSAHGTIKPDISAPGENVRSAYNTADNSYVSISGTSMACPHVAGVVALLKGIRQGLSYNQIYTLLHGNADTNVTPTNQNCGGVIDTTYPNHSFGYGKVNALRSARALIGTF